MSGEEPVLELHGISKSFGSVQALRGADFVLVPGEVHALLGENGAGKSTLVHIAAGLITPDSGRIRIQGADAKLRSPRIARALGIGLVHQHFTSIGALTVSENIVLSMGPAGGRGHRGRSSGLPETLMAGLSLDAGVDRLSVAQRQRLEIVKALATGATTLLLDEPSAVLAPSEVDELLTLIRDFVGRGGAAAFITHKLREVFIAADRVTVLRRGAVTLSGSVSGETEATLALAMIGKALPESGGDTTRPAVLPAPSEPILAHLGGLPLRGGELIGVAAIEGNGQRKLLRDLAQTDSTAGSVALVPEDRTIEGLIPDLSITENLLLGLDRAPGWSSGRWIDRTRARTRTTQLIEAFGIRADGPDAAVRTLSGGNQQKVVLARALERQPAILIAENPTRGLDIRATSFVQDQLRAAARAGMLVLIYSTDLDEVLELGQRVLVVHGGRVTEAPPGADRQMVGEMMLGLAAKGESGSGER